MNKVSLLDCTLRDGAYVVDGKFGKEAMCGIILKLQEACVDIIECGWLKDAPHEEGSSFYHVPSDLERYLVAPKRAGSVYTVMIDWNRYDLAQLPPCDGKSIDAIRVVFPSEHYREGIALAEPIRDKGYQVYFQAANTLGYSDDDLLNMIELINKVKPVSISVVDTFGAMYADDLVRIASLVHQHLQPEIALGFHSHNNLQLSFAMCMEFVKIFKNQKRSLIVDSSLCGMGRGAGNAPTELLADYLIKSCEAQYDMNRILDAIDMYMSHYLENYQWGYSVPYYISGTLCAHVNNIAYLTKTHRTGAHDMKAILETIASDERTQYDYNKLEKIYVEYQTHKVDDSQAMLELGKRLQGKSVLLLCPGETSRTYKDEIDALIATEKPVVIGVNAVFPEYQCDALFFSNALRLQYACEVNASAIQKAQLIVTSNIRDHEQLAKSPYVLNYTELIKRGWKHFDNSTILCLRMLKKLGTSHITLAGFDGYNEATANHYIDPVLQTKLDIAQRKLLNEEITQMFADFMHGFAKPNTVCFLTPSKFAPIDADAKSTF